MKKVLYITANPGAEEKSYGLQVGRKFIEEYKVSNPEDSVVEIDLFDSFIPTIDRDMMSAWGKLGSGAGFESLNFEEARKVSRFGELTEQFVEADKYIFVTPLWNFSAPAVLKSYLDTACVAGKTFKYTEQGPVGLLEGKKILHIQASGGVFSEGPAAAFDHGNGYIKTVAQFIGITDVNSIFVEGTAIDPTKGQAIKELAIEKAVELAKVF